MFLVHTLAPHVSNPALDSKELSFSFSFTYNHIVNKACSRSNLSLVLGHLNFSIILDSPERGIGCFLSLCKFGLVILDTCTQKDKTILNHSKTREYSNSSGKDTKMRHKYSKRILHLNPFLQTQILQVMEWP